MNWNDPITYSDAIWLAIGHIAAKFLTGAMTAYVQIKSLKRGRRQPK